MAVLTVSGYDELSAAFRELENIPEDLTREVLTAMANTALPLIKAQGEAMGVRDPASNVHILDELTPAKVKITPDGGSVKIIFKGSRKRGKTTTTNAAIAFINEFGKRNQPAWPFMGTALEKNEDKIVAAGAEVFGEWQDKTFGK